MQLMGIHNNYKQDRRLAWFCYTVPIFAACTYDFISIVFHLMHNSKVDTKMAINMLIIDFLQISVSVTIAVTFNLLLQIIYTRYANLNLLLRYGSF